MVSRLGRVVLVGAGPGDPDLITVRGLKALELADVVLYDELACDDLLTHVRDQAELINVGKRGHAEPTLSQPEINDAIVEHARAGRTVVRLKGGDPFVFGRGAEEISACAIHGIPFEVVPGITSAVAALAYAGIPVTDRRFAASFAVVTGHKDPSKPAEQTRWRELGAAVDTLVILMGMRNLPRLVDELIAGGKSPDTPAAAVMAGTLPEQRTCVSTLGRLANRVTEEGFGAPAAIVVGDVVSLRSGLSWWERQPLFGRSVLVTRAQDQARELAAGLRAVGAAPVVVPMIELVPVEDAADRAEIERVIGALEAFDAIVWTSSNAVRFFAREVGSAAKAGPHSLAPGIRTFCVGQQTAEAALAAGYPVHAVATGRSDADALLSQFRDALPGSGERVLIPRSRIGRTVIADGLRASGAEVDSVAFYENRRPEVDSVDLCARLVRGDLSALTFTSPSTVDHFVECLDEEARAAASQCIIAAIGQTTARRLEKVGLPADWVPERPRVTEMISGLVEVAAARGPAAMPGADKGEVQ